MSASASARSPTQLATSDDVHAEPPRLAVDAMMAAVRGGETACKAGRPRGDCELVRYPAGPASVDTLPSLTRTAL